MEESKMKYTAPEMEMKALDVEDIIMSTQVTPPVTDGGDVTTPDEEL